MIPFASADSSSSMTLSCVSWGLILVVPPYLSAPITEKLNEGEMSITTLQKPLCTDCRTCHGSSACFRVKLKAPKACSSVPQAWSRFTHWWISVSEEERGPKGITRWSTAQQIDAASSYYCTASRLKKHQHCLIHLLRHAFYQCLRLLPCSNPLRGFGRSISAGL